MNINLFIFPFIIILGLLLGYSDQPKNRKIFILIVSAVLILETSLRSLSVGSDTRNYYWMFNEVQDKSWNEIWKQFVGRYLYNTSEEDIGYEILQKTIAIFTNSWQLFVFVANLIFFIPLGKLIYRHCNNMIQLVFAYILYVALFHIISLSGGRQLYSIGMSIMAFMYMDNKKYKQSFLCIFIGTLIHLTCLLALLPIFLSRFNGKYLKKIHLISFALVPIVILIPNQIIVFMGSATGIQKYENYGMREAAGGTWTFIILLELMSVFLYLFLKTKDLHSNRSLANLYTMVPLFTFFGPLIHSNGSMIRISMYFHLYLMLLIPLAVNVSFKGRDRTIIYIFMILALIVLSLRDGGFIYYFFWQEPHLQYYR